VILVLLQSCNCPGSIGVDKLASINFKLVIHSPYTINIAIKNNLINISYWIKSIHNELIIANLIGAIGCVIHVGKYLSLDIPDAKKYMYLTLKYLIHRVKSDKLNVFILLETCAGQGTELLSDFEELALFYNKFNDNDKKVLKICVDTCHIYSAGFDISTKSKVKDFFKLFNEKIGIENLALIHLNDSATVYNSHVDRHQNIGKGSIGFEGLKEFVIFAYKYKIPIILETPNNGYIKEIPWIKNLV
jgi:deoxyribonuclease-4